MVSLLSKSTESVIDDLESQIARLKREVSSLRKQAEKSGAHAYDEAADVASQLYDSFSRNSAYAGRELARTANKASGVARENPVTVAVLGLALVAAASMLLSRR